MSSLSLFISLRFSRKCYPNNILPISFISVISIIIGVSVLIIGLSAMNGFEYELKNRILAIMPHGEIESINQPWENWLQALKNITKVQGVYSIAPYINFTGLIKKGMNLRVIQIKGIDPRQEEKLSILPQFVKGSTWMKFSHGKRQIILGEEIANTLNIKQGDWIHIFIPKTNIINSKIPKPKLIRLQMIGIIKINGKLDRDFAIIHIDDARNYLSIGNSITGIAIKVNSIFDANNIVYSAGKATNSYVSVKSWMSKYGYMYHDIKIIRIIIKLAMLLLITIACFNIISISMIIVKNKDRDIAILRTLGAKNNLIYAIFIWYGLITGLIGSLCGILLGIAISLKLTLISNYIEQLTNYKFLNKNVYFINFLPSKLHWINVFCIFIITIFLSLLASLYPAYRANLINPAKVLSNR